MSKEDIDKLDKQIELLKKDKNNKPTGEVETVVTEIKDPEDENHVINISYINSEVKETTKELKDLKTLTNEEVNEEKEEEKTKKISVTNIESNNNDDKSNDNVNNTSSEVTKKNNKNLFIILGVVIGVVIILIIGFCCLFLNSSNEDDTKVVDNQEEENKLTKDEMIDIIDLYGKSIEKEVTNYYNQNNSLPNFSFVNNLVDLDYEVVCHIHEIYSDRTVYLDECMVDYNDVKYTYGTKKGIVQEENNDNIKVYVHRENNSVTLTEPVNKDDYYLYSSYVDTDISSMNLIDNTSYLVYFDNNSSSHGVIYNYVLGKKAFYKVDYIDAVVLREVNTGDYLPYAALFFNNSKVQIYNLVSGKAVGDEFNEVIENELVSSRIAVGKDGKYGLLNYATGNLLIPIEYDSINASGNSIIAVKNDKAFVFDNDGNQYLTDISEDGFLRNAVIDKYVLDEKKLYNINGKLICEFKQEEPFTLLYNNLNNEQVSFVIKEEEVTKCLTYNISSKECSIVDYDECIK